MTLLELSGEYRAAAAQLAARIRMLRAQLRAAEDPQVRWALQRRIAQLQPMHQDTAALAKLLEHYYEKGYYHEDRFTIRIRKPEPGPEDRAAAPCDF